MLKQISLVSMIMLFSFSALAQDCSAIFLDALDAVDQSCSNILRNQACYGHFRIEASAYTEASDFQFDEQGDLADLSDIESLSLSAFNQDEGTWGVAMMLLQADLPNTLPGQNVTVIIFGDVTLNNAVAPVLRIPMSATAGVNVRSRPTTNADNIVASLSVGQEVMGTGRLEDNSWIQVSISQENGETLTGWVSGAYLSGDSSSLTILDADAEVFSPMQAFFLHTGIGQQSCEELPESGILIQSPEGQGEVELQINQASIRLGSTIYVRAEAGNMMQIYVLDGQIVVTANGVSQIVPAGSMTAITLDTDSIVSGTPAFPISYDFENMVLLNPVLALMPKTVEAAPALETLEIETIVNEAEQEAAAPSPQGALPPGQPIHLINPFNGGDVCILEVGIVPPEGAGAVACYPIGTQGVVTGDPVTQNGNEIRYPVAFADGNRGWLLYVYIVFD